jgi:hypothetical protein
MARSLSIKEPARRYIHALKGDRLRPLRETGTRLARMGARVDGTQLRLPKTDRRNLVIGTPLKGEGSPLRSYGLLPRPP